MSLNKDINLNPMHFFRRREGFNSNLNAESDLNRQITKNMSEKDMSDSLLIYR